MSQPTPSVKTLDARSNPTASHSGGITGFRWRGLRQSFPLVQIIEGTLADLLGLKRRILLSTPFVEEPHITLGSTTGSGIYGTSDQDTRYNPYIDGILHLQPVVSQLNVIKLQYLRQQLAFKLSTLR